MGRKKRKTADDEASPDDNEAVDTTVTVETSENDKGPGSSGYAMTSHSGEIITEDAYVSDGSDDEDEQVDIVLTGSRMGVMRRGLRTALTSLVQPNRQWVRNAEATETTLEEQQRKEEEDLEKLDPAQRAARLLQEKQRKLEEAKTEERRKESEENAGRDPLLFSKRTAFDIRFDQIEDKPWTRGTGDMTDFFNYGLSEEDWLEYAQHQLLIRQELIDASRQKRQPDPIIVPVTPRTPATISRPAPESSEADGSDGAVQMAPEAMETSIGPVPLRNDTSEEKRAEKNDEVTEDRAKLIDVPAGVGGAWGAGALPGSLLAKLIEEQEQRETAGSPQPSSTGVNEAVEDVDMSDLAPNDHQDEQSQSYQPNRSRDTRHNAEDYYDRPQLTEQAWGNYPPPTNFSPMGRGGGRTPFGGRGWGRGYGDRTMGGRSGRGSVPSGQWESRQGPNHFNRKRSREEADPRRRR